MKGKMQNGNVFRPVAGEQGPDTPGDRCVNFCDIFVSMLWIYSVDFPNAVNSRTANGAPGGASVMVSRT